MTNDEIQQVNHRIRILKERHAALLAEPLDPDFPEASMRASGEVITEIEWEIRRLELKLVPPQIATPEEFPDC